jgi:nickel/cobalt exporter
VNRRVVLISVAAVVFVLACGSAALAHPLGNFTTNTYAGLIVQSDLVLIDYVLDLAEIPAWQARQRIDTNADGEIERDEELRYRGQECQSLASGIRLQLDRRPISARVHATRISFPPGVAGLLTLRLECSLVAEADGLIGSGRISFVDGNLPDRIGWREITAAGDGTTLDANVPPSSISNRLTSYPQDRLQSPVNFRSARLTVNPGGPRSTEAVRPLTPPLGADRITQAFTEVVAARRLTPVLVLAAIALALALGTLHALAPGHGKTVMAAYLIGQQGAARQGLLIALIVAATHTAGVAALGIFLSTSQAVFPERLYPWLGIASGMLFAGIGAGLLRSALRRRHGLTVSPVHHHHHHQHGLHLHGDNGNGDAPFFHSPRPPVDGSAGVKNSLEWRNLVAVGFAGGLVPSPSALLVLLGATALGRAPFGLALVLFYGLGMAAALVGIGFALVGARARLESRFREVRSPLRHLTRALPVLTACLVLTAGLALAARAASGL